MKPYIDLKTAETLANEYIDNAIKVFKENVKNSKLNDLLFDYFKKPEIVWKKRGFRIGASYIPYFNLIKMNINYLYSKDAEIFIKEASIHELALKYCSESHNRWFPSSTDYCTENRFYFDDRTFQIC